MLCISAAYAAVVRCPPVRLSVRLVSVTLMHCVEMSRHTVKLIFHHRDRVANSRTILVFFYIKPYGNIPMGTPSGDVQWRGSEKIAIFDQYLALYRI